MKIKKITTNIIHVNFDTQEELTKTFCRFQEHYESPEFAGKIFTLGQYREWYSERYGGWTYYTDWNGFNIPNIVLEPFKKGLFDPLSEEEQLFLDLFKHRTGKFYIIGTHTSKQDEALDHEICHALYYLDREYKEEIDMVIASSPSQAFEELEKWMLGRGYAGKFLADEIQAYLTCNVDYLQKQGLKIPPETLAFEEVKINYFKKHGLDGYL